MKVSFWSSTEYSGFFTGLIRELNQSGLEAKQCFHISEVSYRSAKTTPTRLWLRFRQYVAYPIQLGVTLLARRTKRAKVWKLGKNLGASRSNDACVVSTNTFYAPLLATYLHPNVVHLVYDLFPEAMIHSGKWAEGTMKVRLVRWITRQTLKRSKMNVFLGQRLKDYVESIYGSVERSAIIAVGADQALFSASPTKRGSAMRQACIERTASPTILYCGNFGNMHDSDTLFGYFRQRAEGATFVASHLPTFNFFCSGPKRTELKSVCGGLPNVLKNQIQIGEGLDQEEWIKVMEAADVALVTMVPGSQTVVMPSKAYSAMMAGQAILAIAPEDSDLVDTIKAVDCGWFVEPGDVAGLTYVINGIVANPEGVLKKRENAYRYAKANLGQDTLANQWREALSML